MKTFKLIARDTENYTFWGYDDKIKVVDTVQEIINYFVQYRLEKYEVRRLKQIEVLNTELDWANEKLRFIKFYLKNSGDFAKKNKSELQDILTKNKFNEIDRLLQIRIYSLTKDEIEKLEKEIGAIAVAIKELQGITNLQMYVKELKELKL
jgi:DNA gyrase/topoisomerase IV subunit A